MREQWEKHKYFRKGLYVIALSVVFNLLETWFFGWHLHAQSVAEGFCDTFSVIGICIGMFIIAGHTTGSMIIEWLDEELRK